MVSVKRAFVILMVAFALDLVARASNAQRSDGLRLSIEDAIAQAEQRAPEVTYARHQVRDAEARRVGAGIVLPVNPRASFDVRPLLRADPIKDLGYGGSLDFLTEIGGAPSARVREARGFVDVAQAELRVQRLQARANVWSAYVRALIAEARIRETRASVEIAERVLNASRQRAEAGASGDIEQSLARSELAQLEATVNGAARERELQVMAIRDALNLDATAPLTLSTPLTEPGQVAPADQLARRALGARADLEAIRRRIDLLVKVQDRLEREVFPRVGGYVGVDSAPLSPTFGIVGLSVELPVAQRNQGPIARTIAQRNGETDRLEVEARRIVRDVYASRSAYESRREQLRILTEGALPTAERTLELVETGWRSGRFDIFRVTAAARDLARVRGLRLDSLEAAWLERIALDRVVGGLGA